MMLPAHDAAQALGSQSIRVTAGRAGPLTGVPLGRQEPSTQRLLRAVQRRRNRRHSRPLSWRRLLLSLGHEDGERPFASDA